MMKKILHENWYYILSIIVLIVLFYFISNSVLMNCINDFDHKVINFFTTNNFNIDSSMIMITNIGYWYIPVLLVVLTFIFIKEKRNSYLLASFYTFSGIVSFVSKEIIHRTRPTIAIIDIPSSYSFPSGHTLTSITFFFMFAYILTLHSSKIKRIILLVLLSLFGLLVGLSRVYLGVHFFSDVIGGIALSIPCLLMFTNIVNKNFKEVLL